MSLQEKLFLLLVISYSLIIFIIDYIFSLSIAVAALYIIIIVISSFLLKSKKHLYIIALYCFFLTVTGAVFSFSNEHNIEIIINCIISLFIILAGAISGSIFIGYSEEKQKLNDLYKNLIEAAPNAMALVTPSGKITYANQQMAPMFRYSDEEFLNLNIDQLVPHPFNEKHSEYRKDFLSNPKKRVMGLGKDLYGLRKDGSQFPLEIGLSPVEMDEGLMVVSSVIDISERKEITRKLKEALDFSDLIMQHIPDLVFIKDSEFKIVQANPALLELYPESMRDKIIGYTTFEKYDEEEAEKFFEQDRIALEQGYSQVEETIHFPNGEERMLSTTKICFENYKGEKFILGVGHDITEIKKSEEKLKQSNEELDRFASIVSHDLQEPLRMISSYTQLLEKRYKDKLDQDGRDYIHYAVDGATRMQSLIQDLLKFSRLSTQSKEFNHIDTNELFDNAILNLEVSIDETGTVVTKDNLPNVLGDDGQLRQLFQNLIGNAVKYRDPEKMNKVHIRAEEKEAFWQFCVEDNGIGIAPEFYKKVFVIFKRLHTKSEYKGTGIGLSLCKRIVEVHNGRIWVESEPGKGSRFYFTLMKILDDYEVK